jgi:peptidoglycan/LPS O-acetylase OafA/YrhL
MTVSRDHPPIAGPEARRLTYQPALDGWRGIGILAVLVYHGGFRDQLPGAFFWIDGFFTVSAFLIATLLLQEHDRAGRVDLVAFWARRVRRLAPALLIVLAGMALFALVAERSQLARLPSDVLATLFYVANWRGVFAGDDYFSGFAAHPPLEHTWSLAIEEQFYLVFPLLLIGVLALSRRRPLRSLAVIPAAGAVLSAGWMAWLSAGGATTSRLYFGTDTRAQALLVGVLLAVVLHRRPLEPGTAPARFLAVAGPVVFVVVFAAQVVVHEEMTFLYRGGFLLVACAQALVFASLLVPGPLQRALAWRPLVWVGAIAYGLYLFHFPVDLWLTPERTGLAPLPLLALRVAVTFAVAVPVYYAVEQPIRRRRWPVPRSVPARVLWPVSVALVAVVALVVTPPAAQTPADELAARVSVAPVDDPTSAGGADDPGDRGSIRPPRIAVVGDSTGDRLATAIEAWGLASPQIVAVGNGSRLGCPMGRGGVMHTAADALGPVNPSCDWEATSVDGLDGTVRPTYATVAQSWDPDLVILSSGLWDVADRQVPGDDTWRHPGDPVYDAWLLGELLRATDALSAGGAHVVLLTLSPWEGAIRRPPAHVHEPAADPARVVAYNRLLDQVHAARPTSTTIVDLAGWMAATGEDARLRPDGAHLEPETAVEVVNRFLGPELLATWQRVAPA